MGSLHVIGGARIIGAGKRRCRNTTGGYQLLWTCGAGSASAKRQGNGLLSRGARAGFFARRPKRHRSNIVPKLLGRSTQIAAFFN